MMGLYFSIQNLERFLELKGFELGGCSLRTGYVTIQVESMANLHI